jgi:hypothetical protein
MTKGTYTGLCIFSVIVLTGIFTVRTGSLEGQTRRSGVLLIGSSYRIYPSAVTQTETFIARHPNDPNILFASANTINLSNGFISEGIYVTTNAGATWFGSDTCIGAPIQFHHGDPGIAIDGNGTFVLIRLGFSPGLYSHYSTNFGLSWSSQLTVATNDQDRATLATDVNPASAYYGRSYAFWVRFDTITPTAACAFSTNGGATWSGRIQVNSPPQRCQGGEVAVSSDGTVYGCWAGVVSVSPFTEDYVGFASSTNGGVTWTATENAFDMNGIAGLFPEKSNIRTNGLPRIDVDKSGGPRNGWIYIVTTEKNLSPAGSDPDIVFHRSTDGGAIWSAGMRVNQDGVNNGKFQYFPAIHVDDGGGINVLYYDDRNTTSDSCGVFLSRSIDGGASWTDFQVSDHHFKPQPIGGLGQGYQGDNIGLTSVGDSLWPVWMDNSSGLYQIWTCPIRISDLGTSVDDSRAPLNFRLRQNYPNPFNAVTTIEYELKTSGYVRLSVYNIMGEEVARLVDGNRRAGAHRILFDSSVHSLSSGVYFFRIEVGASSITRKMALVK